MGVEFTGTASNVADVLGARRSVVHDVLVDACACRDVLLIMPGSLWTRELGRGPRGKGKGRTGVRAGEQFVAEEGCLDTRQHVRKGAAADACCFSGEGVLVEGRWHRRGKESPPRMGVWSMRGLKESVCARASVCVSAREKEKKRKEKGAFNHLVGEHVGPSYSEQFVLETINTVYRLKYLSILLNSGL